MITDTIHRKNISLGYALTKQTDYPAAWKSGDIQRDIYTRANWCCEHCGMAFVAGSTKAKTARNKNGKPRILTVHHLNGNKADVRYENLVALCQACHLHVQGVWQPGGVLPASWERVAPAWITKRGLDYQLGQQWLFEAPTNPPKKAESSLPFIYAKYGAHYRVVSQAFYERNRHKGIVQVYSREIAVEPCQRFDFPPLPYREMLARVEAMQAAFAGFKAGKMVKLVGAAD